MSDVIGIIGGSGMEDARALFDTPPEEHTIITPYGAPSDPVLIGEIAGTPVAFIARHGRTHHLPPHLIPYKANLWALKSLGVKAVIATCIVGSLKPKIQPGHVVVPDQFVNLTHGRDGHSIEADGSFLHVPMGEPYCASLRETYVSALKRTTQGVHARGTVVVIQGPRFSTKAESRFFSRQGWDVVNMTQYPECLFARELGLCYAVSAFVTDYDVGTGRTLSMHPENMEAVLAIFRKNTEKARASLRAILPGMRDFKCDCATRVIREYYREEEP